jgi:hypothetical protein
MKKTGSTAGIYHTGDHKQIRNKVEKGCLISRWREADRMGPREIPVIRRPEVWFVDGESLPVVQFSLFSIAAKKLSL